MATAARKSFVWTLAGLAAALLIVAQLDVPRLIAAACSSVTVTGPGSVQQGGQVTYTLATSTGNMTSVLVRYTPSANETFSSLTDPDALGCSVSGSNVSCGSGVGTVSLSGTFLTIVEHLASSFFGTNTSGTFSVAGRQSGISCSGTYTVNTTVLKTLTVSPGSLSGWIVGTAVNATVTANGTAPQTFVVSSGSLPPGLSLSSAGVISGTPTTTGTYSFSIKATDTLGQTGTTSYSVQVLKTLTVTPTSFSWQPGTAVNATVTANGTAPQTFVVSSGSLPTGLSLSSAGVISGTPTTAGTYSFSIKATDALGETGTTSYSVQVLNTLTVTPTSFSWQPGTAVNATVTANGTAPQTFAIASGSLPPGLSLSSSGVISGTPTGGGAYTFSIKATDALGETGTASYSVTLTLTISPTSFNWQVGTAVNATLTANGAAPQTFAITSGSLPAGLTLSSAGVISGTATTGGTYSFTVTATDADGGHGTQSYTVGLGQGVLTITPTAFTWHVGEPVSDSVTANGQAPQQFSITSGSLPTGLMLASTGAITGTPTALGTFNFTIGVTDAVAQTGSQPYQVVTQIGATPTTLPALIAGTPYDVHLTGTGGTTPYTCVLQSGVLPTWLTLTPACELVGTPPADFSGFSQQTRLSQQTVGTGSVSKPASSSTDPIVIQITDSGGNSGSLNYTLTVGTSVPAVPASILALIAAFLAAAGYVSLRRRDARA